MQHVHSPDHTPASVAELIKRCKSLCASAESAMPLFTSEHETFLSSNLGDALAQLELVLRAVGREPSESARKEDRVSFLRRLFGAEPEESKHPFEPPKFEVTRQGLQGNSSTVSTAELLGFLSFARKTGVLWVDTPGENFLVGLTDGKLRHATSDRTPEGNRLGEVLVGLGYLTRRQLERFIEQIENGNGTAFGEKLLTSGMITPEELRRALALQVRHIVHRVLRAKVALFRFRENLQVELAHSVDMDVNQLLLENAREQDEVSNAGAREGAVAEGWSSWQQELSTLVSAMTDGEDGTEPTRGAKVKPGASPVAKQSPGDGTAAEKKSTKSK